MSYFLTDHLGSTNGLADATGNLTDSNSYDSFGNAVNADFPTRYQFTGREFYTFTGLNYNRARSYDSKIGRFISEDPTGLDGGINQFAYAENSPTNYVDPFGNDVFVILYRSNGKLVVDDYSKHWLWGTDQVTQREFSVFSGEGSCKNRSTCDTAQDVGPIPRGQYLIDKEHNVNGNMPWKRISYKLYRSTNSSAPWNGPFEHDYTRISDPLTGQTAMRGGFYIHPGSVSHGCITFFKSSNLSDGAPWSENYSEFDKIIKGTSAYIYNGQKFAGRLLVLD